MDTLPEEIFDIIMQDLTQQDIHSLRLTSHSICAKVSYGFVRSRCGPRKWLKLPIDEDRRLSIFEAATRNSNISNALKHLVIASPVIPGSFKHESTEAQVRILSKAFGNVCTGTQGRGLNRLTLAVCWQEQESLDEQQYWRATYSNNSLSYRPEIAPLSHLPHLSRPDDDNLLIAAEGMRGCITERRFEIAAASSRVFSLTMQALQRSQLPVRQLDICTEQEGVAIACDVIQEISCASPAFPSVKFLAIRFARHLWGRIDMETGMYQPQAAIRDVDKITRLLHQFPNLEGLDLQWMSVQGDLEPGAMPSTGATLFDVLARRLAWSKLRHLTLGGIRTRESAVIRFLMKHPGLQTVGFANSTLQKGGWERVIDFLKRPPMQVKFLYLGPLVSQTRELLFDGFDMTSGDILLLQRLADNAQHSCGNSILDQTGWKVRKHFSYPNTMELVSSPAKLAGYIQSLQDQTAIEQ